MSLLHNDQILKSVWMVKKELAVFSCRLKRLQEISSPATGDFSRWSKWQQ